MTCKKRKFGFYGNKTRALQRKMSHELFGLSFKEAEVYRYLGSRESDIPNVDDIQNKVFFEVPDRAYASTPVSISIGMDPMRVEKMDFSRFGIINPMQGEHTFRVHIDDFKCVGRDLIIGDVFEIPFYSRDCKKSFWEITDVDDKVMYEQFYVVLSAVPLGDSRTTREIPINRSNDPLMNEIMSGVDENNKDIVPFNGLDPSQVEGWEGQMPEEKVDYRKKKQASFLDDPDFDFTNKQED